MKPTHVRETGTLEVRGYPVELILTRWDRDEWGEYAHEWGWPKDYFYTYGWKVTVGKEQWGDYVTIQEAEDAPEAKPVLIQQIEQVIDKAK